MYNIHCTIFLNLTRPITHKVRGGGGKKFVPLIATLPILGLKFIKLLDCVFYEQFYGFHAPRTVGKCRHQRPTKHIGYFGQRRWLCFSPKLEAENKVLN